MSWRGFSEAEFRSAKISSLEQNHIRADTSPDDRQINPGRPDFERPNRLLSKNEIDVRLVFVQLGSIKGTSRPITDLEYNLLS